MFTSKLMQQNALLAVLPKAVQERLARNLELVDMRPGRVLYEPGEKPRHAYFPTESIVSLLCVTKNGASTEIAIVGNDGIVGEALLLGGGSMPQRAVVQAAGRAVQLSLSALLAEFDRNEEFEELMLRYTQALMTQMAQTAACNRHHHIDQQLCRLLLLSLDRLPGNRLEMTQEVIANRLGVRREGVTQAAGKLQRLGVIDYHRGHIIVLDRPALERLCCECYAVVKKEFNRLLPHGYCPAPGQSTALAASQRPSRPGAAARPPTCGDTKGCTPSPPAATPLPP